MCLFKHSWKTIAFDEYSSKTGSYTDRKDHQIRWLACKKCGKRKLNKNGATGSRAISELNIVEARWVDHNHVWLTSHGVCIDKEYELNRDRSYGSGQRYDHKPLTKIDEMVLAIRNNPEFKKVANHQMVADAMEELQTVIKMHEGLDKPS